MYLFGLYLCDEARVAFIYIDSFDAFDMKSLQFIRSLSKLLPQMPEIDIKVRHYFNIGFLYLHIYLTTLCFFV